MSALRQFGPINPECPIFTFACIRCGTSTRSNAEGACADLHGIPFRSYYCGKCAAVRRAEREALQGDIAHIQSVQRAKGEV